MLARAIVCVVATLACAGPSVGIAHQTERATTGTYSLDLLDEQGQPLRTFTHRGRTYVLGAAGQRYQVRVRNLSPARIEAVISVDGRDALDGKPASPGKRGYLIGAYDEVRVEGFRLTLDQVATFRFSPVQSSYAARMGNARDVGVIGVAIFPERPPVVVQVPRSRAYEGEARGMGSATDGASPAPSRAEAKRSDSLRPGLGTEFGERRDSHVTQVDFTRARPDRPDALLMLRYNDGPGLVALGIRLDPPTCAHDESWLRETAQPFRTHSSQFSTPPPGW